MRRLRDSLSFCLSVLVFYAVPSRAEETVFSVPPVCRPAQEGEVVDEKRPGSGLTDSASTRVGRPTQPPVGPFSLARNRAETLTRARSR